MDTGNSKIQKIQRFKNSKIKDSRSDERSDFESLNP
jgi:hypothetical protein